MRRLIATILLLLCMLPAAGQSSSQKERKARLDREIRILEQQIRDNSKQRSNALSQLGLLRKKEEARRALINESNREIATIDDSIAVSRREVHKLQRRLDTMQVCYNRLLKNAYKNRDVKLWYLNILASRNIGQATRRYNYLRSLSSQMNVQAKKMLETKAELEKKMEVLAGMRARAEKLRASRQDELNKLVSEEEQSKKLVTRLGKEKSTYQKQLASKKKQVEALNREIQKMIAESMKSGSSNKKDKKPAKPIDTALAKEFEANKGRLPWPAEGPVMDHFGRHPHPVYKAIVMPFNNGIGIAMETGGVAKAVFEGEVRKVIVMPGYSKCVLVQHGDYFTFYCKLSAVSVKAGDKLKTGQAVGVVDTIDGQTQLHFQIWKGSSPQDPELWLLPRD